VTHGRYDDKLEFIEISFEILIHWLVGQERKHLYEYSRFFLAP
jgi:hypothetical protein